MPSYYCMDSSIIPLVKYRIYYMNTLLISSPLMGHLDGPSLKVTMKTASMITLDKYLVYKHLLLLG